MTAPSPATRLAQLLDIAPGGPPMPDDPTAPAPPPGFAKAEPVVTAGAVTTLSLGLATSIMELCEAFDWQHFTAVQTKAILGVVTAVAAIGGSLIARRFTSASHVVEAKVAAAEASIPASVMQVPMRDGGTLLVNTSSPGNVARVDAPATVVPDALAEPGPPIETPGSPLPPVPSPDELVADAKTAEELAALSPGDAMVARAQQEANLGSRPIDLSDIRP